ncbi:MAG: diguanylate cyclase [Rhodocyclaceae bacterium]
MHRISFSAIVGLASTLLALVFVCIGGLAWYSERTGLDSTLRREAESLRTTFEVASADLEQQMLALATLLASNERIRNYFRMGRDAVMAEGGGAGAELSALLRNDLYMHVASEWLDMQRLFGLRQLHFQIGPGALSFLRVHAPERYGDRLDDLRHIVTDVNRDHQPRAGFETGRVYSGVRGVVPVWSLTPAGERDHIGALEAGTSFDAQIKRLDTQLNAGFAVLLRQEHVESSVWEAFRPANRPRQGSDCRCYLEAFSRDEVKRWMHPDLLPPATPPATSHRLLEEDGRIWHLVRFPVVDYLGLRDANRPPVGSVLIWREKTAEIATWHKHQVHTWLLLCLAYLISQGLLLWLLHGTRRTLQKRIDRATEALSHSEDRLKRAQSVARIGSWEFHASQRTLVWSDESFRLFGLPPAPTVAYERFLAQVHPEDRTRVDTAWRTASTVADNNTFDLSHRVVVDGEVRWVRVRAELHHDADGRLTYALGTAQDITEHKQQEQALHHLATTDSLTGLPNRRQFIERLGVELGRTQRFGSRAALLMMDIDHFKQVNDMHGHAAGDAVLRHFARIARDTLRKIDLIGRLGGEEFAALLPGTDADGALLLAERLRQAIASSPCISPYADDPIRITLSIGITVLSPADRNSDEALNRADHALYRAKQAGRNRVEGELLLGSPRRH